MSGHMPWVVAPDRKDLVFVPGVAQPMRCGSAERARLTAAAPMLLKAALHCEDMLMRYTIDRIDGEEIADAALLVIRTAIAAATGETP